MRPLTERTTCVVTMTAVCALLATGPARATAMYDAIVSSLLTVESITNLTSLGTTGGLLIDGQATVFDSDMLAVGDATADADGEATPAALTSLGVGDEVDLLAVAAGDAGTLDLAGIADSFAFTEGLVLLDNTSATDTYQVGFSFDYALAVSASLDDAATEYAFGLAMLSLLSTTAVDAIVDVLIEADTDLGLPGDLVADSVTFAVSIAPGDSESLLLIADAEGFAESTGAVAVSLPAGLPLISLGLLALGASKRRPSDRSK